MAEFNLAQHYSISRCAQIIEEARLEAEKYKQKRLKSASNYRNTAEKATCARHREAYLKLASDVESEADLIYKLEYIKHIRCYVDGSEDSKQKLESSNSSDLEDSEETLDDLTLIHSNSRILN
jgi:hypothetical protein